MKLSSIVQEVISLAKAANQARLTQDSKHDSPIVASGSVSSTMRSRMTAEERRLREFLEAQTPAVVYMLTAIMYFGRGDFPVKQLLEQHTDMSETFGDPKLATRQMVEKLPLPEYLEEGLRRLGRAHVDIDKLLHA